MCSGSFHFSIFFPYIRSCCLMALACVCLCAVALVCVAFLGSNGSICHVKSDTLDEQWHFEWLKSKAQKNGTGWKLMAKICFWIRKWMCITSASNQHSFRSQLYGRKVLQQSSILQRSRGGTVDIAWIWLSANFFSCKSRLFGKKYCCVVEFIFGWGKISSKVQELFITFRSMWEKFFNCGSKWTEM